MNQAAASRLAALLGVDAIITLQTLEGFTIVMKLGGDMVKADIALDVVYGSLRESVFAEKLREMAEQLMLRRSLETATGGDLDEIAADIGIQRGEPRSESKMTRFEAIAEEIKKL